ncbi:NOL1/NOP2/sun family putative RNA methylase [Caldicellulosiruptoraceae bacterium PP1]
MNLPESYKNTMIKLLGREDAQKVFELFSKDSYKGFRINTYKISADEFLKKMDRDFEKVPWCQDGYFYNHSEIKLSKHAYYFAGLIYIQEPSAMFAVEALNPQRGEKVLDLCASPGGKSVQIAARIGKEGFLVSNDIKPIRIKPLVKNIESLGITNTVILNNSPKEIADNFGTYFDKILVDAPCSGQGMFRKDPSSLKSWTDRQIIVCSNMQRQILTEVDKLLKVGGELVYSTCTFTIEENEEMLSWFLKKNPNYEVCEIDGFDGFEKGYINSDGIDARLNKAVRIYPHKVKGEGHFVCKLKKINESGKEEYKDFSIQSNLNKNEKQIIKNFVDRYLVNFEIDYNMIYKKSDKVFLANSIQYGNIIPIRNMLYLGELYKDRFYPSEHLAISLRKENFSQVVDLEKDDFRLQRYLKGETIENNEGYKGFTIFCVDGYTLGWAKAEGEIYKNFYPKGWRLE